MTCFLEMNLAYETKEVHRRSNKFPIVFYHARWRHQTSFHREHQPIEYHF